MHKWVTFISYSVSRDLLWAIPTLEEMTCALPLPSVFVCVPLMMPLWSKVAGEVQALACTPPQLGAGTAASCTGFSCLEVVKPERCFWSWRWRGWTLWLSPLHLCSAACDPSWASLGTGSCCRAQRCSQRGASPAAPGFSQDLVGMQLPHCP